ncbi:SDR family oxidoreductase [Gluconobacter sphaericus]|uniref:3-oxoacyl-ACP reductase n=1 Tax=Gluconobacter sphaericus NBRC 12467 TaxID=1307951 RepID=A0AA37SDX0_9PROT|nr:SDR family oxidoreductase [Gluconobacter sphaericus]MBF0885186.1 SDR family oxidoreductase [Gluconobacter sphaericus]GBR51013.1 oxidoreductase [Gluconobacter sphaericus NBRC 12467]GEB41996.1 3-oxoacyl-ACP reductase [Gluconobacter sphaericus NBRC 12467]GLQ84047.1 3-oxoacyl-ACP reductase [Gluconobacter sphaericus NBRC 12467]
MDLGLNGKTALVVGASRGLGRAIAIGLCAEGVNVLAASRHPADIEVWRAELPEEQRNRITALQADLKDRASITALADSVLASVGVDILVNNSGGPPTGPVSAFSDEEWIDHFTVMASRFFLLASRLVPGMRVRKWGRVLTVGSSGIMQPIPGLGLSNGIRGAIAGWSKTLSNEVAVDGVTVNMLIPGRIHTDRLDQLDGAAASRDGITVEEVANRSLCNIPAGRYGRPEEFADAAVFLASERASYITGSQIRIDGGMVRSV